MCTSGYSDDGYARASFLVFIIPQIFIFERIMRRIARMALNLLITLAVFAVVTRGVNWSALFRMVGSVSALSIVASFLVLLALSPVQTFRWQGILDALGVGIPFRKALPIVLIGVFFAQLLPASIGGDAARIWKLRGVGVPMAKAFNSVVLDRVSALLAVVLISFMGLSVLFDLLPSSEMRSSVLGVLVAAVCGLLALVLAARVPVLGRVLIRILGNRLGCLLNGGIRDASTIFLYPRTLFITLALSVFIQLAISGAIWILAVGVGAGIGIIKCAVLVPFVILASMLPISIAGWGVREGAMVFAFGFAGVDVTAALTISVLFGVVLAATGLPGGLLLLYENRQRVHG